MANIGHLNEIIKQKSPSNKLGLKSTVK